jgi:DNA repair exonuclease SbcCD ATPase subunit
MGMGRTVREEVSMHERTGSESSVEELEDAVLGILDLYFEARLREIAQAPRKVGPAVEAYEGARRRLAEAEEELETIRRRKQQIKTDTVDAAVGDSGASELGEQLSELQEEVGGLTKAEEAAQGQMEAAEEALRRTELDFEGDPALSADEVAAITLSKVEEIDAFKAQLDRRFAEGRTSAIGTAI